MTITFDPIQTMLLAGALFLLWRKPVAPVVSGPTAVPAKLYWRTMRRDALGNWGPDGRQVRGNSPAWQTAFDTPGVALESPDGKIVEGRQ